jgi:Glycosyltransferase
MLSADYYPNIGGIASHIFNLSKNLMEKGVYVTILHPLPSNKLQFETIEDRGLSVYKLYYPSSNNKIKRIYNRTKAIIHGLKEIEAKIGGIDILHQHDHMISTIPASLFGGKKVWIWTNHTSDFMVHADNFYKRKLMSILYHKLDGIISVSRDKTTKIKRVFGNKTMEIIPNGVNLDIFYPNPNDDRKKFKLNKDDYVILCPSRMVKVKGISYLADSINTMIKLIPDKKFKFIFLGSDPAPNTDVDYINEIKEKLHNAFLQGYVRYYGNVRMEEMNALYNVADCVVMPSVMEGFSLTWVETLACQKPLIATTVGGYEEVLKHRETAYLIPPQNTDAITSAIIDLMNNQELANHISKCGYEKVKELYSWKVISEKTYSFYVKLLKEKKQSLIS